MNLKGFNELKQELKDKGSLDKKQIKGLVMDYIHSSRELKNDLLILVENGFFQKVIFQKSFNKQKNLQKLNRLFANDYKAKQLVNICHFLGGKENLKNFSAYSSLTIPKASQKINYVDECIEKLMQFRDQLVLTVRNNKIFNQPVWLKLTPVVVIMLISVILVVNKIKSRNAFVELEIVTESKKESILSINSSNIELAGNYLGTIQSNEVKNRFALIIKKYNKDTLLCSLIDFPAYNEPKKNFIMIRKGEMLISQYGIHQVQMIDNKILLKTSDNFQEWNFEKKEL